MTFNKDTDSKGCINSSDGGMGRVGRERDGHIE